MLDLLVTKPRQTALPLSCNSFGSIRVRTPLALPGQRIGVMGGSFNPPHGGHLVAAETVRRRLRLDWVWWVVTPGNPLKSHRELAPLAERLEACRRLVAGDRRMKITSFETDLGGSYTASTLGFLRRRYPATRFVWIMGADSLASLHRWRDWRTIFRLMPCVVVDRPDWRLAAVAAPAARAMERRRIAEARAQSLPARRPPGWALLTMRLSPASSTVIRERHEKSAVRTAQPHNIRLK